MARHSNGRARTPVFRGETPTPVTARAARKRAHEIRARASAAPDPRELLAQMEALRAEMAAVERRLALSERLRAEAQAAEREAHERSQRLMRVPFRVRDGAADRLRDAVAGCRALGLTAIRMEGAATLGLKLAAHHLEKRYNGGRRFPPREKDLPPGRGKQRPKRRGVA